MIRPPEGSTLAVVTQPNPPDQPSTERDRDLVELEELEQEVALLQRDLEAPLEGDDGVTEPLFSDFSES